MQIDHGEAMLSLSGCNFIAVKQIDDNHKRCSTAPFMNTDSGFVFPDFHKSQTEEKYSKGERRREGYLCFRLLLCH